MIAPGSTGARWLMVLLVGLIGAASASAAPSETGDWYGRIGGAAQRPIVLHIARSGSYRVAPSQSAKHIPAAITHDGKNLVVRVPSIGATLQIAPAKTAEQ